jgi:hypothetical protein
MSDIKIVDKPQGLEGEGFFATKLGDAIGLARANSLMAIAVCNFMLRYRIYGYHGFKL